MIRIYKKNECGFTMVELLMVVSIMSMIVAAVFIPIRSSISVWQTGDRYAEVMQNALMGMDKITRELKYATQIISVSPSENADHTPYIQGYIEFKDRLNETKKFQYTTGNGYIMFGSPGSLLPLSGPLNPMQGLCFTCFQSDGSVPANLPGGIAVTKIAVVQVDMTVRDSQGKAPDISIKSKVRVRMDLGDDIMELTDYCMYGRAGVTIKNNAIVNSSDPVNMPANIGALTDIETKSGTMPSTLSNGVQVMGSIVVGGSLSLSNLSLVAQDVYVNNDVTVSNNAAVMGNVNCNGTVNWDPSSTISGYVNIAPPPDGSLDPSGYTGKVVEGGVGPEKFFNPFPPPTTFTAGGSDVMADGNLALIGPGSYGDVNIKKGATLKLTASGTYYFKSLQLHNNCSLQIDLSSGSTGMIQIFVEGDVIGEKNEIVTIIGGNASKVFMEAHGNVYWDGIFHGTIFAPIYDEGHPADHGNITIVNGSKSTGTSGAMYAAGALSVEHPNLPLLFMPGVSGTNGVLPWERTGTFLPS